MTTALASLTSDQKKDPCIKCAIKLFSAWSLNNYHSFFNLYKAAPKMTSYLIDWFVERERIDALKVMIKVYVLKMFETIISKDILLTFNVFHK